MSWQLRCLGAKQSFENQVRSQTEFGNEGPATIELFLRAARIVGGIHVNDLEGSHGVDLQNASGFRRREMLHARRHGGEGAGGHFMRGSFVELRADTIFSSGMTGMFRDGGRVRRDLESAGIAEDGEQDLFGAVPGDTALWRPRQPAGNRAT